GPHIPELDRASLAARRQAPAVRAESDVQTLTANQRPEGVAGVLLFGQAGRVPELDHPVIARRSQMLAVAAEDHSPDRPLMGAEWRPDRLSGPPVPHLHCSVGPPRDQVSAVAVETERNGEELR